MKKFVAVFAVGFAVAIIVVELAVFVALEYHGAYIERANREMLKQIGIRDLCAGHIGQLSGAKQQAPLDWFHQLAVSGKGHRMTEEDLKTCMSF
jgi:hypothetical protein